LTSLREKRIKKEAYKAAREGRVTKFVFQPSGTIFWIVYGHKFKNMYIVIPGMYCSCRDFIVNVKLRRLTSRCYHIQAREIAEKNRLYKEKTIEDKEKVNFLKDIFIKFIDK